MVPEELTNDPLVVKQEHIAKEKAREKETTGEEKISRKLHSEGFGRSFCRLQAP